MDNKDDKQERERINKLTDDIFVLLKANGNPLEGQVAITEIFSAMIMAFDEPLKTLKDITEAIGEDIKTKGKEWKKKPSKS